MIRLGLLIAYLISFVPAQMPSTTDWRGLSPLRSTRMDVERTLGPPNETRDNQRITYYFHDVVVYFYFSGNPKCQQKLSYTSWDVPQDTVTGIDVTLRHPPLVEEMGIDLTKYTKTKAEDDLDNHYYYANPADGFGLEVGGNYVKGYQYSPGSKQQDLRCEATKSNR